MREHRVIHKPSKSVIVPQMPNNIITADGKFYMLTPQLSIYVDMTGSVAIDEFTGVVDRVGQKVYENDVVEAGVHVYEDPALEHMGWVHVHAFVVYNELDMGWNLEIITPAYKNLPADLEWDLHRVVGNRWQSENLIQAVKMGAGAVISKGTT